MPFADVDKIDDENYVDTLDLMDKIGIENAIRAAVPGVGDILDVTDHASGRNPYYTPSTK